jgi:mannose-6-phosphate isomerase-like protein (cupin superfamily)
MSEALTAVRRIVTGHDEFGKSVLMMDGAPTYVRDNLPQEGLVFHELWSTGQAPSVINRFGDPTLGENAVLHPPAGGTVLRIVDIPPEPKGEALARGQADAVFSAVGLTAARSAHSQSRHPLMHRTETIDYAIVLSGEIVLVLDDNEVHAKTGDVIVQCGTIHAWANRGDRPCRMAFVLIDGRYEPYLGDQIASA